MGSDPMDVRREGGGEVAGEPGPEPETGREAPGEPGPEPETGREVAGEPEPFGEPESLGEPEPEARDVPYRSSNDCHVLLKRKDLGRRDEPVSRFGLAGTSPTATYPHPIASWWSPLRFASTNVT